MLMLLYTSNFEPVIMYVYLFFVWFCNQSTEIRYSEKCSCGVEKLFVANGFSLANKFKPTRFGNLIDYEIIRSRRCGLAR